MFKILRTRNPYVPIPDIRVPSFPNHGPDSGSKTTLISDIVFFGTWPPDACSHTCLWLSLNFNAEDKSLPAGYTGDPLVFTHGFQPIFFLFFFLRPLIESQVTGVFLESTPSSFFFFSWPLFLF